MNTVDLDALDAAHAKLGKLDPDVWTEESHSPILAAAVIRTISEYEAPVDTDDDLWALSDADRTAANAVEILNAYPAMAAELRERRSREEAAGASAKILGWTLGQDIMHESLQDAAERVIAELRALREVAEAARAFVPTCAETVIVEPSSSARRGLSTMTRAPLPSSPPSPRCRDEAGFAYMPRVPRHPRGVHGRARAPRAVHVMPCPVRGLPRTRAVLRAHAVRVHVPSKEGDHPMTPDHTPYLVEGDLRTPQDVAAWLDGEIRDAIEGRAMLAPSTSFGPPVRGPDYDAVSIRALQRAHQLLTERLDRERRQACRRAARVHFGMAVRIMREAMNIRGRLRDKELANAVWGSSLSRWGRLSHASVHAVALLDRLTAALAFRAAARAK